MYVIVDTKQKPGLKRSLKRVWEREDVCKTSRRLDKTNLSKARSQVVADEHVLSGGNEQNSGYLCVIIVHIFF